MEKKVITASKTCFESIALFARLIGVSSGIRSPVPALVQQSVQGTAYAAFAIVFCNYLTTADVDDRSS